ncbi:MAG: HAMP domain-containing protein [Phycisphaerales bacterium]|nr:MAG: HAMP domain-containing protein [Phycisphaerales bacterium]
MQALLRGITYTSSHRPRTAGEHTNLRIGIRWKLIFATGVPLLIIVGGTLAYDASRLRAVAAGRMGAYLEQVAERYAAAYDGELSTLAQVARSAAAFLETHTDLTERELFDLVRANVGQHELIYGACIAFEPGVVGGGASLFAPYAYRGPDARPGDAIRVMNLAAAYDYTSGDWEWYSAPRDSGAKHWTEPYFDEGAGDVAMTTFSAPFFAADGSLRGVATIDVRLDALRAHVVAQNIQDQAVPAIISRRGVFLAWPSAPESTLMSTTIFEVAAESGLPALSALGKRMIAGERGRGGYTDPRTGERMIVVYAPIETAQWSLGATVPENVVMAPVHAQMARHALLVLGMLVSVVAIVLVASTWITRPIERLATGVRRLAAGDLEARAETTSAHDEIADLARSFNSMVGQLRDHIAQLTTETAAREAFESELRVAREIQTSMLPRTFPPFPDRPEFDLHAVNVPAKQVAGDFFDFMFVGDALLLLIADVSGKGAPAALHMAMTRTILRQIARDVESPGRILELANDVLAPDNENGMFVTLVLARYEPRTGVFRYANAGHPPLLRVRPGVAPQPFADATGALLGILPDQAYEEGETVIAPGETIVFYTDGVTEARSPSGEMFMDKRLLALLGDCKTLDAVGVCDAIAAAVDAFEAGDRGDDTTVMALRRRA